MSIGDRPSTIQRILLVRLREIGDVVFTTPAVRAIRQRFPAAHITYIVESPAAPIVLNNPNIDRVIIAGRRRGVRQLAADLALGWRLRRLRFDLAIDFHGGPRASLLTWLSGASTRIGYDVPGRSWMYTQRVGRPRELRPRHSVANQWDLLSAVGLEPPDAERYPVQMWVDASAAERVSTRLLQAGVGAQHGVIVVHVSAGNPFRRWPIESFAALASGLAVRDARRRIVVTSGPSEADAAARVIAAARERLDDASRERVLAAGEFSLNELRALLERAALYIGGDSGPLHVASTTGVPIVALYGPTLPARSAPWRSARLIAEAVEVNGLACRPCDQRACAPGDFRCLTSIDAAEVVAAAERALARAGADKMSTGS